MHRNCSYLFLLMTLLLSLLASSCAPALPPAPGSDAVKESSPSAFTELETFQAALLQAIQSSDQMGLAQLMTENFTSGWWRGEMGDLPRADALRELYSDQLGSPDKVGTAANVDLKALMGGTDPLSILRPEVGVVSTLVMTGWGKDGEDEAILFIARQPDSSLRWAGTMVIIGGFTSPQTGGVQLLVNALHGYQMYLPLGVEVTRPNPNRISIAAPQGTEGERGYADITVEPAGGRTVEQVVEELKPNVLADVADQTPTFFGLDTELALVFDRVPSQEIMRLLFVVHEDRLYRMNFYPQDDAQPTAYAQMRNTYAVITNTFKFIPLESNVPVKLDGASVVADLQAFTNQLQYGLIERNKVTLQSMMGDHFSLAVWQSEGIQITPDDAIQQILNNYVPLGVQPVLDLNHPVIARLYPQHPISDAGEELIPVYAAGWGQEGKDEAILFIARRADGSLYWQGVLTAAGGFGQ